jgi:hypothetical protein
MCSFQCNQLRACLRCLIRSLDFMHGAGEVPADPQAALLLLQQYGTRYRIVVKFEGHGIKVRWEGVRTFILSYHWGIQEMIRLFHKLIVDCWLLIAWDGLGWAGMGFDGWMHPLQPHAGCP